MLGIKKKEKSNDLDDLLGEIKIEKKKDRKKNNDFFNDLELWLFIFVLSTICNQFFILSKDNSLQF